MPAAPAPPAWAAAPAAPKAGAAPAEVPNPVEKSDPPPKRELWVVLVPAPKPPKLKPVLPVDVMGAAVPKENPGALDAVPRPPLKLKVGAAEVVCAPKPNPVPAGWPKAKPGVPIVEVVAAAGWPKLNPVPAAAVLAGWPKPNPNPVPAVVAGAVEPKLNPVVPVVPKVGAVVLVDGAPNPEKLKPVVFAGAPKLNVDAVG